MVRPIKLTPIVQKNIVELIRRGNYFPVAAEAAGITYQSFRGWMRRGEAELERVKQMPRRSILKRERPFVEFYKEVKLAEAEAEAAIVEAWDGEALRDWRAGKEFLSRRYGERWGERREIKLEIDWRQEAEDAGFDPEELLQETIAAILAAIEGGAPEGSLPGSEETESN